MRTESSFFLPGPAREQQYVDLLQGSTLLTVGDPLGDEPAGVTGGMLVQPNEGAIFKFADPLPDTPVLHGVTEQNIPLTIVNARGSRYFSNWIKYQADYVLVGAGLLLDELPFRHVALGIDGVGTLIGDLPAGQEVVFQGSTECEVETVIFRRDDVGTEYDRAAAASIEVILRNEIIATEWTHTHLSGLRSLVEFATGERSQIRWMARVSKPEDGQRSEAFFLMNAISNDLRPEGGPDPSTPANFGIHTLDEGDGGFVQVLRRWHDLRSRAETSTSLYALSLVDQSSRISTRVQFLNLVQAAEALATVMYDGPPFDHDAWSDVVEEVHRGSEGFSAEARRIARLGADERGNRYGLGRILKDLHRGVPESIRPGESVKKWANSIREMRNDFSHGEVSGAGDAAEGAAELRLVLANFYLERLGLNERNRQTALAGHFFAAGGSRRRSSERV